MYKSFIICCAIVGFATARPTGIIPAAAGIAGAAIVLLHKETRQNAMQVLTAIPILAAAGITHLVSPLLGIDHNSNHDDGTGGNCNPCRNQITHVDNPPMSPSFNTNNFGSTGSNCVPPCQDSLENNQVFNYN